VRSHDMWRNGFRTRAKLGIDRFDPGRRRIMDLHKQMFSEGTDSPKVNMATPVELPGDKVLAAPCSSLSWIHVCYTRINTLPLTHLLLLLARACPSIRGAVHCTAGCTCVRSKMQLPASKIVPPLLSA